MATIIEIGIWTLTDAAAEHMAADGLIVKCDCPQHNKDGLLIVDQPIYHKRNDAPDTLGFSTMMGVIRDYEKFVENKGV